MRATTKNENPSEDAQSPTENPQSRLMKFTQALPGTTVSCDQRPVALSGLGGTTLSKNSPT
jgi:hypothetical protein